MGRCMCEGGEQTLKDAFKAVGDRIMKTKSGNSRPYGEYMSAKKKAPDYLAKDAHLLKQQEYVAAYKANRAKANKEAADKGRKASAEKRDKAILAAKQLPPDKQAAAIAAAEKQYAFEMEWHGNHERMNNATAGSQAYQVNGFVDDDGQLYANLDGPTVGRTVHHESVHKLASPAWHKRVESGSEDGHNLDEAATEYFTRKVGQTTPKEVEPIYQKGPDILAKRYSDDALARAYFGGDFSKMEKEYPIKKVTAELSQAVSADSMSSTSPMPGLPGGK